MESQIARVAHGSGTAQRDNSEKWGSMQESHSNAAEPAAMSEAPAVETGLEGASDRDAIVRRTELIISNILRGGVLLSATVITVGIVLFFVRDAQFAHVLLDLPFPHSLGDVMSGLAQGNPVAIIALGLLLLLSTPVVNVAVSIVAFAVEGDKRYVVIAALVLAILIASFLLGKGSE